MKHLQDVPAPKEKSGAVCINEQCLLTRPIIHVGNVIAYKDFVALQRASFL